MSSILVIDDHDTMREGMAVTLKKEGHDVVACRAAADGLAAYRRSGFDLVITDLKMDGMNGIELVQALKAHDPEVTVMVVTAFGTIETAVTAMQQGAFDFITKPFSPEVLRAKVASGLTLSATRAKLSKAIAHNAVLQEDAASFKKTLIGESEPIQKLRALIRKAASADATVHIQGESGTGKELVARMLHQLSPRAEGPFVVVNCAALPETLLESELFGHERGAFTGAVKRRIGRFELADKGTLFLDEIGDISPAVQTKLLRVLQEREFQRVGGEQTVKCDVRVVSATHKNLKHEVENNRFREDLYYRLHIVPVMVPPLRERPEDIPELARHFITKHAPQMNRKVSTISDSAVELLKKYGWPGNVRELENAISQSLVFAETESITAEDLPMFLRAPVVDAKAVSSLIRLQGERPLPDLLESIERTLIEQAFEKAGKVKTETARLLGIKTSALYYKLEKYGVIAKGEKPPDEG